MKQVLAIRVGEKTVCETHCLEEVVLADGCRRCIGLDGVGLAPSNEDFFGRELCSMTLQRKLGQKKCMFWLSADEISFSNQRRR